MVVSALHQCEYVITVYIISLLFSLLPSSHPLWSSQSTRLRSLCYIQQLPTSCLIYTCCACLLLSHVQLFAISWTVARQASLSMGFLRARILEWVSMPSSRGSSQPSDWTQASRIAGSFFPIWATRKAHFAHGSVYISMLLCQSPYHCLLPPLCPPGHSPSASPFLLCK